jgi:hypothetical protein
MVPSFRWRVEGFKEELIGYIPTKEGLFRWQCSDIDGETKFLASLQWARLVEGTRKCQRDTGYITLLRFKGMV